jgi:hypothetical protein
VSPRPTEHPVDGGVCVVCGELESWLRDRGALVVTAGDTPTV